MVRDDPNGKRFTFKTVADRADAGFMVVARSLGSAVGWVAKGGSEGLARLGGLFVRKKKRAPRTVADGVPAARRISIRPISVSDPVERARRETPTMEPFAGRTESSTGAEAAEGLVDEMLTEFPDLMDRWRRDERHGPRRFDPERADAETGRDQDGSGREPPIVEDRARGRPGAGVAGPDVEALVASIPAESRVDQVRMRNAAKGFFYGAEVARRSAQETLVAMGPTAEMVFITGVGTSSPRVVELSLEGLELLGSGQLVDCVVDLASDHDQRFRLVALRVAQRLAEDDARRLLLTAAQDPSAIVRRRVVSYLSWRESKWARAALRRLCDDPDASVGRAATAVLKVVPPEVTEPVVMPARPPAEPTPPESSDEPAEQRVGPVPAEPVRPPPAAPAGPPEDERASEKEDEEEVIVESEEEEESLGSEEESVESGEEEESLGSEEESEESGEEEESLGSEEESVESEEDEESSAEAEAEPPTKAVARPAAKPKSKKKATKAKPEAKKPAKGTGAKPAAKKPSTSKESPAKPRAKKKTTKAKPKARNGAKPKAKPKAKPEAKKKPGKKKSTKGGTRTRDSGSRESRDAPSSSDELGDWDPSDSDLADWLSDEEANWFEDEIGDEDEDK